VALALVQGVMIAGLFTGFGTLLFQVTLAPAPGAIADARVRAELARRSANLARLGLALTIPAGCAWLVAETAVMAAGSSAGGVLSALPVVLSATGVGHVLSAQIVLTIAALVLVRAGRAWRLRLAAILSGLATALQAWHLHAAAMHAGPSLLLVCELVHVLAAAGWLGMLPALFLLMGIAPVTAAFAVLRRFSPFGAGCVLALAVTALYQGFILVGSWRALWTTAYGWMVLVKLALFAILIGIACRNQFRLARLLRGGPGASRAALRRSLVYETAAGLAIVLAASVLANLPPGMDMTGMDMM
jgi:putative copper resistance protein D